MARPIRYGTPYSLWHALFVTASPIRYGSPYSLWHALFVMTRLLGGEYTRKQNVGEVLFVQVGEHLQPVPVENILPDVFFLALQKK